MGILAYAIAVYMVLLMMEFADAKDDEGDNGTHCEGRSARMDDVS